MAAIYIQRRIIPHRTLSPGNQPFWMEREHCVINPILRDMMRMLREDGWFVVRSRGSHQQLKHPTKLALVTVPGGGNDELAPGTLNSLLKQGG
jgi:predicted RNA binding protein YcfA (HicA-like mRNA interferase family)